MKEKIKQERVYNREPIESRRQYRKHRRTTSANDRYCSFEQFVYEYEFSIDEVCIKVGLEGAVMPAVELNVCTRTGKVRINLSEKASKSQSDISDDRRRNALRNM
jgi:hypothetical protein